MASTSVTLFTDVIAAEISWTTKKRNSVKTLADRPPDGISCNSIGCRFVGHRGAGYERMLLGGRKGKARTRILPMTRNFYTWPQRPSPPPPPSKLTTKQQVCSIFVPLQGYNLRRPIVLHMLSSSADTVTYYKMTTGAWIVLCEA